MRVRKNNGYNNIEQLYILNSLCTISSSPIKINKLLPKKIKKFNRELLLEKNYPNKNRKFINNNNDYSYITTDLNKTYNNKNYNNFSFTDLSNVNGNNLFTESDSVKCDNKSSDIIFKNYKQINNNDFDINNFKKSFQPYHHKNRSMITNNTNYTNYKRDNRYNTITPSDISKDYIKTEISNDNLHQKIGSMITNNTNYTNFKRDNKFNSITQSDISKDYIKTEISNDNNEKTEIKKEQNINYSNVKKNNNSYNYDIKHKMRFLLSKKYKNKNIIKRKNITNSSFSITSINNNSKEISINDNMKKNENNKTKRLYSTLEPTSNKNDISNNSPMANLTSSNIQDIKESNNIFLKNIYRNNNEIKINLEDLIILERRLNDIILALNNNNNESDISVLNESFEFFSFYYQSSLQNKFPLFFNEDNRIIIKSAVNLNLFMILILYHLSLNPSMLFDVIIFLRKIFNIFKINLLLIFRKIEIYYGEAFCIKNKILLKNINIFLEENNLYDLSEKEIIGKINDNCISIIYDIENNLNNYQVINNKCFTDFQKIYLTISKITEQDINEFFYEKLYNNYLHQTQDNKYLDKIILIYKKNKKIPPFINFITNKKYTLVLNLENTLINVKIDNKGKVLIRKRPGLLCFLNGIKPFYEIISFTKLSKEYSNIIINEIEENTKIFDYQLYREHCILIGKEFIKDISRIGRDIQKIIIVDYLEDNLKYYPDNGILIPPYNVDENGEDIVLFELQKLLISFFRFGYEDIRVAINNYKNKIYNEIYNEMTVGNEA